MRSLDSNVARGRFMMRGDADGMAKGLYNLRDVPEGLGR